MYEFDSNDAYEFANFIGIRHQKKGDELQFYICPYCKGGSTGKDKGTFSINLRTGVYKCLRNTCGVSGNMITLSRDFDFSLGRLVDEYYKPKKKYRTLPKPKEPIKPKPEAVQYFEKRGISEEVVNLYEITVCNDKPNILAFPFYDENGILQFVKYRKTDFDKTKDKNKEWCEANCKPILFGMKQCIDFSRLTITEGQIDSISITQAGIKNAVSVPTGAKGFTWIPYCWEWINKFEEVVIFGDYEKGHISLLDELKNRLKTSVKHVREEDYKDCKDANEILLKYGEEQVRKCVENAIIIPIKQVKNLALVEDIDIYKIPKISTGIKQIDRLLYGGLPTGGITIVTGKCGNGKSTLTSQIIVSALSQGIKCFAYSGELSNFQFKAWLDFQIAGGQHVFEYNNQFGDKNFGISKANKVLISNWYNEKCYIYDNSVIAEDEHKELLEIVKDVVMQYGVKLVLVDNLMTAMENDAIIASDKIERQSKFVHKLAKIALDMEIVIILVAHKRKNNYSLNENDEISGSSDITNLGTVIISYDKDNEIKDTERMCKITKNRLFGKTSNNGFVLQYDEKSKRIYGVGDDKDIDYGWFPKQEEVEDDEFTNIDINEFNPFNT